MLKKILQITWWVVLSGFCAIFMTLSLFVWVPILSQVLYYIDFGFLFDRFTAGKWELWIGISIYGTLILNFIYSLLAFYFVHKKFFRGK